MAVYVITRRRKTVDPCPRCGLHRARCICAAIPRLVTRTRLSLIIHHRELKRTTNTGRLAVHALENSAWFPRGLPERPLDLGEVLAPGYESVLLYPDDAAIDLNAFVARGPVNLIVPDGNWRQAGKVHRRHPELARLTRVRLSRPNADDRHLRAEHFAEGFSTLAAIAAAFTCFENPETGRALLDLYRIKLDATLAGRPSHFLASTDSV